MSIVVEDAGLIGFRQFSFMLVQELPLNPKNAWTHGLINLGLFGGE
jgi:hypothetical protein